MTPEPAPLPSESLPAGSTPAAAARRRLPKVRLLIIPVGLVAGWFGYREWGRAPIPVPPQRTAGMVADATGSKQGGSKEGGSAQGASKQSDTRPSDDEFQQMIPGDWTRRYSGVWTMTIREDGTGVMTVIPDRVWALVVGSKITIDMEWQISGGRIVFDSVRGEPESSFKVVMKLWKSHQDRVLVEVSDENLVYLSDDGKSQSKWTRVRE